MVMKKRMRIIAHGPGRQKLTTSMGTATMTTTTTTTRMMMAPTSMATATITTTRRMMAPTMMMAMTKTTISRQRKLATRFFKRKGTKFLQSKERKTLLSADIPEAKCKSNQEIGR